MSDPMILAIELFYYSLFLVTIATGHDHSVQWGYAGLMWCLVQAALMDGRMPSRFGGTVAWFSARARAVVAAVIVIHGMLA